MQCLEAQAPPLVWAESGCRERYGNLLEQASEGVFVTDKRGLCLMCNPAGARMLGYSLQEIVGQRLIDSIVAVDGARLAAFRRQLRAGRTVCAQKRFRRKDGGTFPGVLSARRLSDSTIQCILRDVSGRYQAENRVRDIFENSPIGVFFVREAPDGRYAVEAINPCVAGMLGVDRATIVGMPVDDLLPAGSDESLEAFCLRCLGAGAPVEYETGIGSGGAERLLRVLLVPLREDDGGTGHVAGFVHDITGQKRAEVALRESEARFSTIFHSSPDAIVVSDLAMGRVLEANDSFLRILGRSSEQIRGKTLLEIGILPDAAERARVAGMLEAHIAVRNQEIHCSTPTGRRICLLTAEWIELGGRPCVLSLVDDVTEIRRADRERNEAAERERRADADFARRLIESQEAERRRIARELHDSLGQELLLVTNRLQLALGRRAIPADLRAELENIGKLATQAVVEVRRLSHGLHPPQLDHLGLTLALRSLLDGTAQSEAFRIVHHLDDIDGLYARDVAANWYRILQESLCNILKHARARNVEVVLERDIHVVRLIVADDGCGFAPEAAEPGGLGLRSIAERVRILGGQLRIDSAPGTGTRLEVAAPIPKEI